MITIKSYYKALLLAFACTVFVPAQTAETSFDRAKKKAKVVAKNIAEDFVRGPIGWIAHAKLARLCCKAYSNDGILLKAAAIGATGVMTWYYVRMFEQWAHFNKEYQAMDCVNTNGDPSKRTLWAGLMNGYDLWQHFNSLGYNEKTELQKKLITELASNNHGVALNKVITAVDELDIKLSIYTKHTNILDIISEKVVGAGDSNVLLVGNDLTNCNIGSDMQDALNSYAQNSLIANSLNLGTSWSAIIGARVAPKIYTATYNKASQCVVKVLEQYIRLKAVKRILEYHNDNNQDTIFI